MDSMFHESDRLFLIAERLAREFDLFPSADPDAEFSVQGLLSTAEIATQNAALDLLDIDSYIEAVVSPAEKPGRENAVNVIRRLGTVVEEVDDGPYFDAVLEVDFHGAKREVGFIAQNRQVRNGEWMPEHHFNASQFARRCCRRRIPIVSFMDTPGAAGDEVANRNNQAHNISRLIAEMSDVDVPNLGIIFGLGYSGGAIPLAASNMILSVRDGVFSTIQPRSLASIARRLNLSWQECAKHVGLSPFELMAQGNIDGIIDFTPEEADKLENLRKAIISAIESVERSAKAFVLANPYMVDHYRRDLMRFLEPSERLLRTEEFDSFGGRDNPTEYANVFGVTYRYLRYLRVRRRIKATSKQQYGRLSQRATPKGELQVRIERERRRTFLRWLQDPDRIIYDDSLKSSWNSYLTTKLKQNEVRGRFSSLVLGEPKRNFENARRELITTVGLYLYNRWKTDASGNLTSLLAHLKNAHDSSFLIQPDLIASPLDLVDVLKTDGLLSSAIQERFTYDGRKLLNIDGETLSTHSSTQLRTQLALELNLLLTGGPLSSLAIDDGQGDSARGEIEANRIALNRQLAGQFTITEARSDAVESNELTVINVLLEPDLHEEFVNEVEQLRILDAIYDATLDRLNDIAQDAEGTQSLRQSTVQKLFNETLKSALTAVEPETNLNESELSARRHEFVEWFLDLSESKSARQLFGTLEEWKRGVHSHLSDTLLTIVTFYFERLLISSLRNELHDEPYEGRVMPRRIGRKKDFWHRLNIAYRDLRIQTTLTQFKRRRLTNYHAFVQEFFDNFEELFSDRLSTDPVEFPGFRLSIEKALAANEPPSGVVTGIGEFKTSNGGIRVGTVISNPDFQAGAFDMASAEKFCRLLVVCADERLPVVCFISSGGMQTKEGAGALFSMAAINDRITRFVRDFDLPIIIFGHGDCTGGAQASFVTHPLVHTYYFSGTSMPFAGQIVIQSNLPSDSIISNYLASVKGSMQGLVMHPFYEDLDSHLSVIDPQIPVPEISVTQVVENVLSGVFASSAGLPTPSRREFVEKELYRPVKRVLVHARGCAASKIVQVARSIGVETVLVQSDPDIESVAVDLLGGNDTAVCIGGNTPDESYLNARSVLAVASNENVDALHPGIGFLSENSRFAELVRSHGINFIGPPVVSMETMGNKSNAINTVLALGVPVVPGSHGIVTDPLQAAEMADSFGYPILIKAVHGGGGKGIQVVESPAQFHEMFQRVTAEARAAFGDGDVYLEKFVTSLRHIEAQILRDSKGNTKVLGIRDCSVQRDKQKVIEESGSTMLPDNLLDDVLQHSAAIPNAVDYVGAGTVEFIYDLEAGAIYFMEMNTRLQVEHPVTELVSDVNIVEEQFRIASGETIDKLDVGSNGYAIEARVNAESVALDVDGDLIFQSSAGAITKFAVDEQKDISVITTAGEGKFISPYYDSMIMQIIAHGKDRNDAAKKLAEYLKTVQIEGICTNVALLRRILSDDVFLAGEYDTNYLIEMLKRTDIDALVAEIQTMAGTEGRAIGLDSIRIEGSEELKVLSPTTGIFYLKPSPSDPDYVNLNEMVDVSTTLCQLEAFKVFTPLRLRDFNVGEQSFYTDVLDYTIKRINVATGQQVNAGDLLFVVEPTSRDTDVSG